MDGSGNQPELSQRVAAKMRPSGRSLMHQSWGKLLFIHWEISQAALSPHIPDELEIDTYDGKAYIAITPFTLWNVRPFFTPPLPLISRFHEINVRTYVHYDGFPGVWFFSLDANSLFNVLAARTFFHLPYMQATIDLDQEGRDIDYDVSRAGDHAATFSAEWSIGEPMRRAEPNSLDFFLTERYCLYTKHDGKIYRARIHHETWPLQNADLRYLETDILLADGLPEPEGDPLVFAGGPVNVEVWPLELVTSSAQIAER
jgi:uncharacterized protein